MEKLRFNWDDNTSTVIFGKQLICTEELAIYPTHRILRIPTSIVDRAEFDDAKPWQLYDDPELVTFYADGCGIVNKDGLIFEFDTYDIARFSVEIARHTIAYQFAKMLRAHDTVCSNLLLSGTSEFGEVITEADINYTDGRIYNGPLVTFLLGSDTITGPELTEKLSALAELSAGLIVNRVVSDNGVWRGMAYIMFARPDDTYDIYLGDAVGSDSISPRCRCLAVPRRHAMRILEEKLPGIHSWDLKMGSYVRLFDNGHIVLVNYDDTQFDLNRPSLRVFSATEAIKEIRNEVRALLVKTPIDCVDIKGRYYSGLLIFNVFGKYRILIRAS